MAVRGVIIKDEYSGSVTVGYLYFQAGPSLTGHAVKVLATYGPHVTFEGSEIEGAVIMDFPTMREAKAWYNSPAWQEVREYRFRGTIYRAFFVEGV